MKRLLFLAALLIVLVGCSSVTETATPSTSSLPSYTSELHGAVFDPPRVLSDFTMASTTGENFTLSDYRGQVILLYFGYRACPDFCPTTFAALKRVYTELNEPADHLKVVFITVDPERDDLAGLASYTQRFDPTFIGLRDDGATLQQVMGEFGIVAQRRQLGDSPESYTIDHTASVFLIGPDGRLEAQYLYGTDHREITHDVNLVLQTL